MGLHRRKHRNKVKLPDFVGIALVISVIPPALLWWQATLEPVWGQAPGEVVGGEIVRTHYNAQPTDPKVDVRYQYTVRGVSFDGEWAGFWPSANSPNAVAPSQLEEVLKQGHALVVLYDPNDPARSQLHYAEGGRRVAYAVTTAILVGATIFYFLRVYPIWRRM